MNAGNCGACRHWQLVGPMVAAGFGQCAARPEHHRTAITTPAQADCRIGKFVKADVKALKARENSAGTLL